MGFRPGAAAVAVCFACARAAQAEPVAVAVQGFYESPQLFAPAVYVVLPNDNGGLQFSQVGWTARFEGERFQTAHWSLNGALEFTPLYAQSSNLFYENGREDDSRDFRDTALVGNWGVAFRAPQFRAELRNVALKHWLEGLPESTAAMWRLPYTGADFQIAYQDLQGSDLYLARARGLKALGHAQALLGRSPFALAEATVSYGTRIGPLFALGGVRGVYVSQSNLVSRWLLGGSFDAQGAQALFGHPFAEYRVERAATALLRLDLDATRALSFGLRGAAALMPEGLHHGEAAVVTLDCASIVLSAGLGVPDLEGTRVRVFATVMAATFL
jgi:hypothetical protein